MTTDEQEAWERQNTARYCFELYGEVLALDDPRRVRIEQQRKEWNDPMHMEQQELKASDFGYVTEEEVKRFNANIERSKQEWLLHVVGSPYKIYTIEEAKRVFNVDRTGLKLESGEQRYKRLEKEQRVAAKEQAKVEAKQESKQARLENKIAATRLKVYGTTDVAAQEVDVVEPIKVADFVRALVRGVRTEVPKHMRVSSVYPIARQNGIKVKVTAEDSGATVIRLS